MERTGTLTVERTQAGLQAARTWQSRRPQKHHDGSPNPFCPETAQPGHIAVGSCQEPRRLRAEALPGAPGNGRYEGISAIFPAVWCRRLLTAVDF